MIIIQQRTHRHNFPTPSLSASRCFAYVRTLEYPCNRTGNNYMHLLMAFDTRALEIKSDAVGIIGKLFYFRVVYSRGLKFDTFRIDVDSNRCDESFLSREVDRENFKCFPPFRQSKFRTYKLNFQVKPAPKITAPGLWKIHTIMKTSTKTGEVYEIR